MKETNHGKDCRKSTRLIKDNSESENKLAGHSHDKINSKENTKNELIEKILHRDNLNEAFKRVKSNKGTAGIDGITTEELLEHLKENKDKILGQIRARKYKPKAVKRVQIPKSNGKKRNLGIPTTTDRVIQQAIAQILSPIYENKFSENSYGFRPNRNAHDALKRIKEIAEEGYTWVVDLDLEKYFDTVNQSKLIQILSEEIKDGDVISLIHKYLKSGIMIDEIKVKSDKGVPQGGPLSPLLANIYLNEADQELEKWGYKFVRYADDMLIFARNRKAAERYYKRVKKLLEGKLKLKVNEEKTSIRKLSQTKYLGYGFYHNNGTQLKVHKESLKKLTAKLKAVTSRSNALGYRQRRIKINQIIRGWIQYFKLANMRNHLQKLDEWLRRRIRMCAWKSWKKIKTKFTNLVKLGTTKYQAWQWANTRKSYWRIAKSPVLNRALNNKRIAERGYISLVSYYNKVHIKL
ncbi:group II intron reverse transcriptase/maturase [Anaerococcus murdochii]|uniref:RNA-directed DNA polymerase n=1 Tax=Anaerococcus murdochii TaxID=411577 RepID=A0ABS7SWL3_9FIRM|nr:group II intron reverse transcriptase/maturase [Anaerococcus murdochii]MBZ2385910.1 group II intron reverse transcriptase/maturase [Anaerococcus murdochii]MBZ2386886.1 group II intron reverse transcriptase/maturase [Anaerococcus murdochii]